MFILYLIVKVFLLILLIGELMWKLKIIIDQNCFMRLIKDSEM